MDNIISELKWRRIVKDISNEEKIIYAQKNNKAVYCGFDPTSSSLHIGNLIQLLTLKRFLNYGFKVIAIIGSGTAMIGDPSGKKNERKLLSKEEINLNIKNIKKQINKILPDSEIICNDWLKEIKIVDFLRDVGKHFNVSFLLNKEHINSRINVGLSYTEFAYTLLQSYDFAYLYKKYDTFVQIGGSDQWGNITSGIEYIKSVYNKNESNACGLTIKLLLKQDGTKFGKTETGTIWLDKNKTNPYDFYQFFFNQDDDFCIQLLNYFTFFKENEIEEIKKEHLLAPNKRYIQKKLAYYVTKYVHSTKDANDAVALSNALFNSDISKLKFKILKMLFDSLKNFNILNNDKLIDVLVNTKIMNSKREANEFILGNAININGKIINDKNFLLSKDNSLNNKYFLIRKGKKKYFLLTIK